MSAVPIALFGLNFGRKIAFRKNILKAIQNASNRLH